ncbi:ADP-ribosylglycohydrolase family protein [Thermomonospora amylolytica]|uniref:ADP-ribosylglycohydrolase family protein n=1 Tax=Thermomonospora amylolytica TaxID=1411117 RepID=UPI000E6C4F20|nr:ADP-ribosylglycohydrolase family protein [Thermomonospora amylolytica]
MSDDKRRVLAFDSLVGLSVGDAFGNRALPLRMVARSPEHPESWAWTDDTQMACSLLAVIDEYGTVDQTALARAFAARAESCRFYGMGAMQFILHVRNGGRWEDVTPRLFGGKGSWGNGGAMRVAPLGAYFHDDLDRAATEAAASAEVTHSHPEGVAGAVAIGVAAAHAAARRGRPLKGADLIDVALRHTPEGKVHDGLRRALELLGGTALDAARELGNGSYISAPDTVPFVLWTVATHLDDYETAIRTCADVGGDTDTTAAMVGGILTAYHGTGVIPADWLAAREPLPAWLPVPPG